MRNDPEDKWIRHKGGWVQDMLNKKTFPQLERRYKHMLSDRNQADHQDSGWQLWVLYDSC